jgi:hypothetical protein
MELTILPDVFAVRWIADRWLLIALDPQGPHGGWMRLPLSGQPLMMGRVGFLPGMASEATVRRHEG